MFVLLPTRHVLSVLLFCIAEVLSPTAWGADTISTGLDMVFAGSTTARFAALQSGAVDATILGAPFDNRAEVAGFSNLGLTMEYVKDLPFSGYVVNKAWASGNLATIGRFLAAYQKSVDWFYDDQNRDQAIELVVDLSHEIRRMLQEAMSSFVRSNSFRRRAEFPRMKYRAW
jgi:hypothetical protein